MGKSTRCGILILAALAGAVPGCDAYDAFRRCGLQGCPGDQRITAEIQARLAEHPELLAPK